MRQSHMASKRMKAVNLGVLELGALLQRELSQMGQMFADGTQCPHSQAITRKAVHQAQCFDPCAMWHNGQDPLVRHSTTVQTETGEHGQMLANRLCRFHTEPSAIDELKLF